MKVFNKYFSDDRKIAKELKYVVSDILDLEPTIQKLTDAQLKEKTTEFKERLAKNETLDDILVEAFAVAREACFRVTGLKPFPVQVFGAILLHNGEVAQMFTGEGKTITAIMPVYLNALLGKGVHVVTVNQYLTERDAKYNGEVFEFLGLTCKYNKAQLSTQLKREAYAADVTYTTNSELGFDYLRDNMCKKMDDKVQRGLYMAVVDEVDSILIDEAKTPLIISGGQKQSPSFYDKVDKFAQVVNEEDYHIDLEAKTITLSDKGELKAQRYFNTSSFYNVENNELVHYTLNALKAHYLFFKDREYIIRNKEILLVDQFTGYVMEGRSYSDGLQQAIQAKEKVTIEPETMTVATITYQNFFRLYSKLSGMTGTAKIEEEEFMQIYNMRVICVPSNKPIVRLDATDFIFASSRAKYKAIVKEVKAKHTIGQPILLGTTNVNTSEIIGKLLSLEKIPFNLLNARQNSEEAEIISRAGQKGMVTIATNMAGRGTDIKLGEGIAELGGLVVLGTERHESRRIDNQLRGRSGRQGDPGYTRFYLSIEDELLLRFGADKLQKQFSNLKDKHIESKMLANGIKSAQKRIEALNFDTRKNILEYDNVLSQQRSVIYSQRDLVLSGKENDKIVERMLMIAAITFVEASMVFVDNHKIIKPSKLEEKVVNAIVDRTEFKASDFANIDQKEAAKKLFDLIWSKYLVKKEATDSEVLKVMEQQLVLNAIDDLWTHHIDAMTKLKSSIHLRGYAQKNPLQQYIEEADSLFQKLKKDIAILVAKMIYHSQIVQEIPDELIPTDISSVKVGFR